MSLRRAVCRLLYLLILCLYFGGGVAQGRGERLELVGRLGGGASCIELKGTVAYTNEGLDLVVFDIANPAAPRELARLPLPGIPVDMAASGNHLYVITSASGLIVFDITQPQNPRQGNILPFNRPISELRLYAKYAYCFSHNRRLGEGILIVDLSQPASPVLKGEFALPESYLLDDMFIDGSKAYVKGSKTVGYSAQLLVFDLADPGAPLLNSTSADYLFDFSRPRLFVRNNVAFFADYHLFSAFDLNNPTQPTLLTYFHREFGYIEDMVSAGNILYLCSSNLGIIMVDIGNVNSPRILGVWPSPGAQQTASSGGKLFLAGRHAGLQVLDLSRAPALSSLWQTPWVGSVEDLALVGQHACLANDAGLSMVDLSHPSSLRQMGRALIAPANTEQARVFRPRMAIINQSAYVAHDDGLQEIDISNPYAPTLKSHTQTAQTAGLACQGNLVFQVDYDTSKRLNRLNIFEAGPSGILQTKHHSVLNNDTSYCKDMSIVGNLLCIAGTTRLKAFDVSNPASPLLKSTKGVTSASTQMAVAQKGSLAYIAGVMPNFSIYDYSNPAAPSKLGQCGIGESGQDDWLTFPNSVTLNADAAYVTSLGNFYVLDIHDKTAPQLITKVQTPASCLKAIASGEYVYVADSWAGLLVYEWKKNAVRAGWQDYK